MKLKCLVIDDDRTQRQLMEGFIKETGELEFIGSFENAISARNFLESGSSDIDLIFLDVEMPLMTGLEFLNSIKDAPKIILVTSKKEYAVESYNYHVSDYILKPVSYTRFLQAINKVKKLKTDNKKGNNTIQKELFVKVNSVMEKVKLEDILFIEAAVDYIQLVTSNKKILVNSSMGKILNQLPSEDFIRVHRSYIVRLDKVDKMDGNLLVIKDKHVKISKSYKNTLISKLNIL